MYNSYFGFPESPFTVTPDPRFFYSNPVYQEVYASLRYGIEAKKGFIAITGEVGTGKTTMLRKLMRNLEGAIHSVFIFNTYLNFPELLQLILHDLGLASKEQNKVTMLQELNDYLLQQLKQDHIVAVLIDEAQNLNAEALEGLRLLTNLETDQEKLIQIVLMGQPELEVRLDQPNLRQLKQRVALRCRLVPLKGEEVGPYIDFRLQAVGYQGNDLFHPDAVQQIAFYSKGIPRLINIICDNALLIAFAGSQKIVSADMIKEVAGDLKLGADVQAVEIEPTPVLVSNTEREAPIREGPTEPAQRKASGIVRAGVRTLLVILVFVAVAFVIPSQDFLGVAGRHFEIFKHNLNRRVAPATHPEAIPEKANADVGFKRKEQRVVIQQGATIGKIAGDAYGDNVILGMDLIKEFNPKIKNLNWVFPGQALLLPPLTRETLLREQPDGSYRLIAASFRSRAEAGAYARLLGERGYQVIITSNLVSDDLWLHRVEIDGLKNLEEATQTWETGLRNEWFAFVSNPGDGDQISRVDLAY